MRGTFLLARTSRTLFLHFHWEMPHSTGTVKFDILPAEVENTRPSCPGMRWWQIFHHTLKGKRKRKTKADFFRENASRTVGWLLRHIAHLYGIERHLRENGAAPRGVGERPRVIFLVPRTRHARGDGVADDSLAAGLPAAQEMGIRVPKSRCSKVPPPTPGRKRRPWWPLPGNWQWTCGACSPWPTVTLLKQLSAPPSNSKSRMESSVRPANHEPLGAAERQASVL